MDNGCVSGAVRDPGSLYQNSETCGDFLSIVWNPSEYISLRSVKIVFLDVMGIARSYFLNYLYIFT